MLLLLLGSCKSITSLFESYEEEEIAEYCEEEDCVDLYYDSLRIAEHKHYLDSCEMVLQTEWDSLVKAHTPEVSFVDLLADSLIEYAKYYIGVPYYPGGNGPERFDCSGFTSFVFRHFGYELSRTAVMQLRDGWKLIEDPADLRRGDLVFYGARRDPKILGHVGIVVDNDVEHHRFTFIHASVKVGVGISTSTEKYYRMRYLTACRILPEL